MRILEPLVRHRSLPVEQRWGSLENLYFAFQGNQYPIRSPLQGSRPDIPDASFQGYIDGIYRTNGVVAAAVVTRALLLSQLRFVFRRDRYQADAGRVHASPGLRALDKPGSSTRSGMLFQLELDASFSGSGYVVRDGNKLRRLIPDHVSVILGSNSEPEWDGETAQYRVPFDAEVAALLYHPERGKGGLGDGQFFFPGEFAIWSPEPDPVYFWRGSSWVTSVLREIVADGQATDHQQKFFENAATPNLVFMMDPAKTAEQVKEYAAVVNATHSGSRNAYKNMYLGGGTDVKVVGSSLESLNMKDLQGGLENRVAIRSRVPAVILGAREGLSGSSLNAGNYQSARRMLADGWFAPTAEALCQTLESVVRPPNGSELWYDRSEVLFLQEDQKDAADIMQSQSAAMRQWVDGGFDPQSVIEAVATGDIRKLKHTGNLSVQLQPPGSGDAMPVGDGEGDRMRGRRHETPMLVIEDRRQEPEPPIINVQVEPTPVTVNVEPPIVNVAAADVRVEPTPIDVHVAAPEVAFNPSITVPPIEIPPAVVNVDVPAPNVTVDMPVQPRMRRQVKRDSDGRISEVLESFIEGS